MGSGDHEVMIISSARPIYYWKRFLIATTVLV